MHVQPQQVQDWNVLKTIKMLPNERAPFSCFTLKGPLTETVRRKELVVLRPTP
jgi:hypothetical protein